MQYPSLPANAKSLNIASSGVFSPYFDIVWSFDYAISGNSSTEAGFALFLQDSSVKMLTGGSGGIDLGYSGLSSFGLPYSIKPGISGAVIGIGFDTTGLFAASASIGSTIIRDGIDKNKIFKNSITIRSNSPEYDYEDYSYTVPLTSLNTTFSIVESAVNYKTIRARLGNVGRTFYIDYRNTPQDDFKNILTRNVILNSNIDSLYRVGVSFATPISSNNPNATGNIYLKNFHVEGTSNDLLSAGCDYNCDTLNLTGFDGTGVCIPIDVTCLYTNCVTEDPVCLIEPCLSDPPAVINFNVASIDEFDQAGIYTYLSEGICVGLDSTIYNTCTNAATGVDLFNFGYKLNVTGDITATLLRYETFGYRNSNSTIIAKLNAIGDGWNIRNTTTNKTYINTSALPVGTYTRSGSPNLTVTYAQ